MSIKSKKGNLKNPKIKEEIEKKLNLPLDVKDATLEVGFFENAKYPNGEQVAQVASKNEFGTPRIPPRPFFRNAIKKNANKWGEVFKREASNKAPILALGTLGEVIRSDIVQSINQLNTPPNSPSTIEKKGSSKPLVDTGKMRASVNFRLGGKK